MNTYGALLHLLDFQFDIAGIALDFALSAGRALGYMNMAGVGFGNKRLFGKQGSCYAAGAGFNVDFAGVAAVQLHIAGGS